MTAPNVLYWRRQPRSTPSPHRQRDRSQAGRLRRFEVRSVDRMAHIGPRASGRAVVTRQRRQPRWTSRRVT